MNFFVYHLICLRVSPGSKHGREVRGGCPLKKIIPDLSRIIFYSREGKRGLILSHILPPWNFGELPQTFQLRLLSGFNIEITFMTHYCLYYFLKLVEYVWTVYSIRKTVLIFIKIFHCSVFWSIFLCFLVFIIMWFRIPHSSNSIYLT